MIETSFHAVGVVGRPIEHSLSPLLHRAAFQELGLAWTSAAIDAGEGDAQRIVELMRVEGFRGLSVTMPLKIEIAKIVDDLDESASDLGSVNCVTNNGGHLTGSSTDGDGFLAAIEHQTGFRPHGARAVLAGSGGAARSIISALSRHGVSDVAVIARSTLAVDELLGLAGGRGRHGTASDVHEADLVIDTTPFGMVGADPAFSTPLIAPSLTHSGQIVADLVYVPRETHWLEECRLQGAEIVGGLGMLVHQAALALEIWTGQSAPVAAMWSAADDAAGRS